MPLVDRMQLVLPEVFNNVGEYLKLLIAELEPRVPDCDNYKYGYFTQPTDWVDESVSFMFGRVCERALG